MSKGIYYEGDVFFRRYDANGVLLPDIIEIAGTKCGIKSNNDIKKRFGKGRGNHGRLTGSSASSKPTEIVVGLNEIDPAIIAMLFLGTSAALNISGGSVTGESITLVLNQWVKTANRNISASAITALTLGTDFIEHKRMGAIKALTPGAVGVQSLSYTYSGITGQQVAVGSESSIDVEMIYDGENKEDGTETYIRVPKMTLSPDSEIDLLADDYVTAELKGEAVKLPNEPGDVIIDDNVVY